MVEEKSKAEKTETPKREEAPAKKLEDFKNSEENKKIISEESDSLKPSGKEKSKPAVGKKSGKDKKEKVEVIELEREYVIPLKRNVLKAPQYRRAKKAIRVIREFLVKHMRVEDRDLRKVKIDKYLNNEIWFRGIKKPVNKIKVKAVKKGGIVYVELVDIPEAVKYVMARDAKRALAATDAKKKTAPTPEEKSETDRDGDGVADKVSEAAPKGVPSKDGKDKEKSGAEKEAKTQKVAVKAGKHTTKGAHAKKTMPVRKTLK